MAKKEDEKVTILWSKLEKIKQQGRPVETEVVYNEIKNQLAEVYYDIVEDVAGRMSTKLREITTEECKSYGIDGLYEAIDKFDLERGIQFKTFAPYRITGAILDNIRKADWVPRLVRHRNNKLEKLRQGYFKEHGINPTDEWLAEKFEMDVESYHRMMARSMPISMVSMNTKPRGGDDESDDLSHITTRDQASPIDAMLRDEMFKKFMGKNFTKLERKIVFLHYYEGLTMKEIADETKFSESRISQMHGDILRRLRSKVERNPKYAADLEKLFGSV